ncbi:MAG: PD-(D/E)XK nuclease family protein [Rhodothermales bacterium]|nr:PD-(D/E)XK nuclease family protein [Rhodothermales bacterium]MBO6779963.1 PD-(D/E)XK nuclease family protein [Rhodothermales bacterium]
MPESLQEILARPGQKTLLVPSPQAGRKIVAAWARSGLATLGVRPYTPGTLAEAVLAEAFPDRAVSRLPDLSQVLGMDAVLRGFDFRRLESLGWSGQQLARSARLMRLTGISPDEYKSGVPGRLGKEVSEVYHAFTKWLYAEGAVDETERLVQAEFALSKTAPPGTVLILEDTPVSDAARSFIEKAADRAEACFVVGDSTEHEAGSAGAVFSDWERVGFAVGDCGPTPDLVRVGAVEDEARFVFNEVVRRGLPIDSVEVAYPRHTPYLPLLIKEAGRRGFQATSAAGVPLSDLPVGQAVRLLLAWLASGQDSLELVRLLRSGFVTLPDNVAPHQAVSWLIEVHVAGTRAAYRKAFQGLRKGVQEEKDQAAGTEREKSARIRFKRVRDAERAVDRLFDYVPAPDDTLHGFADRLRRFVEALVPADENPESAAARGRAELISRLAQMADGPDSSHSGPHLVARFAEWLDTLIVHARLDKPGTIHFTPLDSAALAGRAHLFVVGMDAGSFLPSPVEDVFLPDDFCRAFERLSAPLTSEDRVERRRLALRRALARARQSVAVVVSEGRIADDSDAGPASSFLELEREYGTARRVRLTPARGLTAAVLGVRRQEVGRRLMELHLPAAARGIEAREARASSAFTEWDGFVGPTGTASRLLESPLSPSRLQKLATCPFQFFQGQILGVPELRERKRGEWMTPLENGSLVHDALSTFNSRIMAGEVRADDTSALEALLLAGFKTFRKGNEPPNEYLWNRKLRELRRIAQVVTSVEREVVAAELGFGVQPWRQESEADQVGEFRLDLDGTGLLLRGRIDVVERTARGVVITDYKTGRSDDFNEQDLLDDGRRLQWVLYAYAYEQLRGERVDESGYLFVSGDAAGQTAYASPPDRETIAQLLGSQLDLARHGTYGASVEPSRHCKWCDYRRVCGDLYQRRSEMQAKLDAGLVDDPGGDGVPAAAPGEELRGWTWAEKYVSRRRR